MNLGILLVAASTCSAMSGLFPGRSLYAGKKLGCCGVLGVFQQKWPFKQSRVLLVFGSDLPLIKFILLLVEMTGVRRLGAASSFCS